MSGAQFTKGPWEVVHGDGYGTVPGYVIDGGEFIVALAISDVEELPAEANANLIAASPDLYEALRQCRLELSCCADQLAVHGQTGHPGDSVSRALKAGGIALAKARGETA